MGLDPELCPVGHTGRAWGSRTGTEGTCWALGRGLRLPPWSWAVSSSNLQGLDARARVSVSM